MRTSSVPQDDLTVLKGIGPARQQWLRSSFGVRTLADLAALLPDDIEARLKADGQIARRQAIEEWVAQAQALADAPLVVAERPLSAPDWRPFASFVVEIQAQDGNGVGGATRTAVQHIETDENANWPGIEREKLCNWILAQVDQEVSRFAQAHQPPLVEPAKPAQFVEQLDVWQPPTAVLPQATVRPERPLSVILQSQQPFTLAVKLAAPTTLPLDIQLQARNLQTGQTRQLAQKTISDAAGLTAVIPLPAPPLSLGQYRLTLSLADSTKEIDSVELPFVQVIDM